MKLIIFPTDQCVLDSEKGMLRVWKGMTPRGNEVSVLVACLACDPDDKNATDELEAEFGPPQVLPEDPIVAEGFMIGRDPEDGTIH